MEDDRRTSRRETGSQGHELSGLNGEGIRGWEHLHRSVSAARWCEVNVEGLDAKARWVQEDESKLFMRKASSGWKKSRTSFVDGAR